MRGLENVTENNLDRVDSQMVVDLLVQVVARLEELHHFKVVLVWVHNLIVDDSCIIEENLIVILSQTQAHHLGISLDVVELVNVN